MNHPVKKDFLKPIHILFLAVALVLIWLRPVAASSLVDARIRQLEFQVRSLQTQLNQIPNSRPRTGSAPPPPPTAVPTLPGDPTLAQQFDNLATLAIELKQRVSALEEQVEQLSQ